MSKSSITRIAGVGPLGRTLTAWVGAVILLVFGGKMDSLVLIGAGSVVLVGSIAWVNRGAQSPILPMLPVTVGIYLMVSGLYFESTLLQWAGILLVFGHALWSNRSDIRAFVGRGDRNDD